MLASVHPALQPPGVRHMLTQQPPQQQVLAPQTSVVSQAALEATRAKLRSWIKSTATAMLDSCFKQDTTGVRVMGGDVVGKLKSIAAHLSEPKAVAHG